MPYYATPTPRIRFEQLESPDPHSDRSSRSTWGEHQRTSQLSVRHDDRRCFLTEPNSTTVLTFHRILSISRNPDLRLDLSLNVVADLLLVIDEELSSSLLGVPSDRKPGVFTLNSYSSLASSKPVARTSCARLFATLMHLSPPTWPIHP
ncbi:hypothetical protein PTI98_005638 [Pleurotus ostreatus]|nr:hypothetical protein PTI98_005638 [Pleurotus ostreatus]